VSAATIHLFEDDADLRDLLVELLQSELDANVVTCSSLADLLKRSSTGKPDLIVADFWGVSQLTLSDDERDQVMALGQLAPTVLVSARQWALDAGPDELGLAAVVRKPLDVDEFVTQLRQALPSDVSDEIATDLPGRDALSVVLLPWSPSVS
jgi:DNA-binding NtrC family response regulator